MMKMMKTMVIVVVVLWALSSPSIVASCGSDQMKQNLLKLPPLHHNIHIYHNKEKFQHYPIFPALEASLSQRSDQFALCTPTCDAARAQEKIKQHMRSTPPCLLHLGLRTAKLSICRFTSLISNTSALISGAVEAREEKKTN